MTNQPSPYVPRAFARKKRDQRLRRICRQLVRVAPHLDDPRFAPLVRSFGRLTLLLEAAYDAVRDTSPLNSEGELRSSLDAIQRLSTAQLKLARELGLSPTSVRSVSKEKAVDLPAAFARVEEEGPDEAADPSK